MSIKCARFSINQVKSVCFVGFLGCFFERKKLGGGVCVYLFSQTYIDSTAKFIYPNESQILLFLFSNNLNVVVVVV